MSPLEPLPSMPRKARPIGRRPFLQNLLVGIGSLGWGGKSFAMGSGDQVSGPAATSGGPGSVDPSGGQASGTPPASRLQTMPIVDTHLHLWDLKKLRLPWLRQGDPLCRDHLLREYLREAEGLHIVQAVYMEVDVHQDDLLKEAEYVLDLCQQKGSLLVGAVLGGRPGEPGFAAYIQRFKGSPWVKGVRRIPRDGNTGIWQQKEFIEDIRLLGELGMCFDLCMPPQRLPDAIKLVDACPDTRFVLDHCGNADPVAFASGRSQRQATPGKSKAASSGEPSPGQAPRAPSHDPEQWRRDMAELARRKQVVCKISGIVARVEKADWTPEDLAPIVHHCLEVFGPDRVIFASDWPVCTRRASLRQWVLALKEIVKSRSDEDNEKLFCHNAVRFYRLALPRQTAADGSGSFGAESFHGSGPPRQI